MVAIRAATAADVDVWLALRANRPNAPFSIAGH
jgi:hypothetical protein